jgi:hypothetical protein
MPPVDRAGGILAAVSLPVAAAAVISFFLKFASVIRHVYGLAVPV